MKRPNLNAFAQALMLPGPVKAERVLRIVASIYDAGRSEGARETFKRVQALARAETKRKAGNR